MTLDNVSTRQLAQKIKARKKILEKVVNSIIELVSNFGKITKEDRGNSHTRVIRELQNFGNFTFQTDLGQTMFGGNTIKIWHHPRKNFREGGLDSAFDKVWYPILDVYFQARNDYVVSKFTDDVGWQRALLGVLKNQKKITLEIQKKQEKAKSKLEEWREDNDERIKLIAEAKRLGIL